MPVTSQCPNEQELQRLLLGQAPRAEAELLEDHLIECGVCAVKAAALEMRDTLVEDMRAAARPAEEPEPAVVAELIARVKTLAVSAASSAGAATLPESGEATPSSDGSNSVEVTKDMVDFLAPAQAPGELGRLGTYHIKSVLGTGGMGVVFLAEDPHLQRPVALKAMKPALAAASARERFLREARATAKIRHDHIVTIYQVGEDRGLPFLAMELLEGETLEARLKREGALPVAEALRIARQTAEGLAAAHKRGLIHRDIKPGNIWLESETGRVKVLDFGLAKAVDQDANITQSGAIVGTPAYMAPEQARGEAVDHRCDLFSLGCVLYRMLTGQPAFRGVNTTAALLSVSMDEPTPPAECKADVSPALSQFVMRLLAKNPAQRPESARAVIEALEVEKTSEVFQTSEVPSTAAPLRATRPWRRRVFVAALLGLAFLGPLAWFFGGTVIRFATNRGELIVQIDDPKIEVTIKGDDFIVYDRANERRYVLTPGKEYELEVRELGDNGVRFATKKFTISRGGRERLSARLLLADALPAIASSDPDIRILLFTDRAQFEALLKRQVRTVDFDDIDTSKEDVIAFAAERYQKAGIIIKGADGQYAGRTFGFGEDYVPSSKPNSYAPGPRGNAAEANAGGNTTDVTFRAGAGDANGLVAGFGAVFIDADFAALGPCSLAVFDRHNKQIAVTKGFSGGNASHLFRGLIAVDKAGNPIPVIGRVQLVNGSGWPAADTNEGVTLDDFVFGVPVAAKAPDGDRRAAEWVLSLGGELEISVEGRGQAVKAGEQLPPQPFTLINVDLPAGRSRVVDDNAVENLRAFAGSNRLALRGQPLTDAGIARLASFPGLVHVDHLELFGTKMGDKGLAHLEHLRKLRYLDLGHTAVTDEGLEHVRDLTALSTLNLAGTSISGDGLKHLRGLPALSTLMLPGTKLKDAALEHLRGMKLQVLLLSYLGDVTDAGAAHLAGLSELVHLDVTATSIGDDGLARLKSLRRLELLVLDQTKVTGAGLVHLTAMTQLKELHLAQTKLTAAGVKKLAAALRKCKIVSDHGTFGASADADPDRRLAPSRYLGHNQQVRCLALSSDGRRFVSGSFGQLWLWEVGKEKEIRQFRSFIGWVHSAAISPDGERVLAGGQAGFVRLWSADTGAELAKLDIPEGTLVDCVAFSPDGRHFVYGGGTAALRLCAVRAPKEELRRFPGQWACFSQDGKQILTAAGKTLYLSDVDTGAELATFPAVAEVAGLAFSSDAMRALVVSVREREETPSLLDLKSGKHRFLEGHPKAVSAVAISADGKRGLTGGADATVTLWNLDTGKIIKSSTDHTEAVTCVAISADGEWALSGGWDKSVRLWKLPK